MGSRVKSPGPYSRKQTPRHFQAFYLSIPPRLFKSQPRHASHLTSHNYTKVVAVSAASSTAAAWFSSSTVRPFKSRICSAEKEMLIHVKVEELEECVEMVERGSDRVLRSLRIYGSSELKCEASWSKFIILTLLFQSERLDASSLTSARLLHSCWTFLNIN
ncbi:hypothetical protein FCM35_KLT01780 [Carex littledalei]|uniref:Uncharacterized protein n=1 Tax=Carex littledalei TaxID=544730 RepID=A0A833VRH3_9POAL|nr:hypothetical protein FCM35_KLT01780 [Carex littledalei]